VRSTNDRIPFELFWLAMYLMPAGAGCAQGVSHTQETEFSQLALGAEIEKLSGDMAFSPDGKTLAVASYDGLVRLIDLNSRGAQDLKRLPKNEHAYDNKVVYSRDGKLLAVTYQQEEIAIVDTPGTDVKVRIPLEKAWLHGMVFTAGDHTLVAVLSTTSKDGPPEPPLNLRPFLQSAVRWELPSGKRLANVNLGKRLQLRTLSPDGHYATFEIWSKWGNNGVDVQCGVFDLATGARVIDLGDEHKAGEFIFSADASALLQCRGDRISFLEMPSGKEVKHLEVDPPFGGGYTCKLWKSLDGRLLAVGLHPGPGTVTLISLESGRVLNRFSCGDNLAICERCQLSPDGRLLATQPSGVNSRDQHQPPLLKVWRLPGKF
jgi:WD40 repeat protein